MEIRRDVSISLLISKIRHGYWILSRQNWNSVSGIHISFAGLLGVAGFILAINKEGRIGSFSRLLWTSDQNGNSEKLWLVPGLQNLGNNCFLNVILQALASCSCFQNYLRKVMEKYEFLSDEEQLESFPLTVSLAALLEELGMIQDGRTVLSPRKVMHAMDSYIPNFNLTSQQDAAEAFLHLMSSLREEFSESYVPTHISLADISTFPSQRIYNLITKEDQSEQKRWQQLYLGPFDGILGSILTCQSCSAEIMTDFEFFHSLPLSPVLGRGGNIMAGCTVEDCLKQFIAAEQIDNYQCSRCWHNAAAKYLLSVGGNEADISSVQLCGGDDSCGCRNLLQLKSLPWSNSLSQTFKQLSIARCPKILCLHLQRASMNEYGDLIKLQGHVDFPMVLNLTPFMKSGVGIIKNREEHPVPYFNRLNMEINTRMLNHVRKENSEQLNYQERVAESNYHLVSVVEHFGRAGSGHYTAYRRTRASSSSMLDDVDLLHRDRWFSISDSQVHSVSEKDLLSAEASLLFYEKISKI